MVKHYREGNIVVVKRGGVSDLRKQRCTLPIGERTMASLKRNHSGSVEKRVGVTKESKLPKKKVVIKYIEETSSDTSSSEEESNSSDGCSSSSEYEPSPSKRPKKSRSLSSDRSSKGKKESDSKEASSEEEEYVVEKIVDMRRDNNGKRFFQIKWLNYSSDENTWEPIENLGKCQDIVDEFLAEYKKSKNNNNNNCVKRMPEPVASSEHKVNNRNVTPEGKNDMIPKNEIYTPDMSNIRNLMMSSVQKVVDVDATSYQKPKDAEAEITTPEDIKSSQEFENNFTETFIAIPNAGDLFYVRIIDDGQVNWIYIDLREPVSVADIYYRCVVTEDLTGKQPKLIYGATTAVDGEIFCLVQFEGHSYVEIIPPENFFLKFPTFKRFFELQCPHLFPQNSL